MSRKTPRINYSRLFDRQLKRAPLEIKIAFRERLSLFIENPQQPVLRKHSLKGKLKGYWSFNVTGDWRAIYAEDIDRDGKEVIIFEALGTHSQLYC